MKTPIEISDALLEKAKRLAREQGLTLCSLTEEGLAKVIDEHSARTPTKVKPVTMKGKGLQDHFKGAPWSKLRDAAYG